MIQSIDQQFHFVSIVVKKEKNPGTTTFHRPSQLSFPDYSVELEQNIRHKTAPTPVFTKIFIVHRLKMQKQILLFLLFATSVSGRPTGREIAQVSFMKKNFGKILFGRKKNWVGSSKTDLKQYFIHLRSVSNLLKEMTSTTSKPDFAHVDSNRT